MLLFCNATVAKYAAAVVFDDKMLLLNTLYACWNKNSKKTVQLYIMYANFV